MIGFRPLEAGRLVQTGEFYRACAGMALLLVVAIFAPQLAPFDPNHTDMAHTLAGWSAQHWLGTDGDGRDIFSRLLYATRISVGMALGIAAIVALLGTGMGLLTGFGQNPASELAIWITDGMLAVPTLLVLLLLAAIWRHASIAGLMGMIAVTGWPGMARMIRAQVRRLLAEPFVDAARTIGASPVRILVYHLGPHLAGLIAASALRAFAGAIYLISALSFLGLGIAPPTPDWGSMLAQAVSTLWTHPLAAVWPGLFILWAVWAADGMAFGLLGGEGLRWRRWMRIDLEESGRYNGQRYTGDPRQDT